MKSQPDYDTSTLQQEYLNMKQTVYQKFILFLVMLTAGIILIETYRSIVQGRLSLITMKMPVLIVCGLFVIFCLSKPKRTQNIIDILFCLFFYLCGLAMNYYTSSMGHFETPIASFYFGYGMTFMERLMTENIPTLQYKIWFTTIVTLGRLLMIPPADHSGYVRQIMYLALALYFDMNKEKYNKELFSSYFNYKEQLVKFRDLVVEGIPEGIAIISHDLMNSLFVNNSFKNLAMEVEGLKDQLSLFKIHYNDKNQDEGDTQRPRTLLEFLRTFHSLENKATINLTYSKSASNEEFFFEAKIFPIIWDKQPSIAIILHDITQQRTILSLQIADSNKDLVLATVSHELRTPLNSMLGMLNIMKNHITDSQLIGYVNICRNSGKLLLGLVNSILDLNQIRNSKLKLNPELVDIQQLLQGIAALFEFQCKEKGLSLQLSISSKIPRLLYTDGNRLTQIFINLIGNALKFTFKGKIMIIAKESANDDRFVEFEVQDTGIGIKEEDKGKLFQMFGRLEHHNNSINSHGVGLGLTISDNLVRLLNNNPEQQGITANSKYGEGTSFKFTIKKKLKSFIQNKITHEGSYNTTELIYDSYENNGDIAQKLENYKTTIEVNSVYKRTLKTEESATTNIYESFSQQLAINSALSRNQSPLFESSNQCILIVDDHPFNLTVAKHILCSYGFSVETAFHGQEAIDLMRKNAVNIKNPIRLVLMDCQMPVMDGYETTKELRDLMKRGEIPEVPIIALTANDSELARKKCEQAGMCGHLSKPLDEKELKIILKKYLSFC